MCGAGRAGCELSRTVGWELEWGKNGENLRRDRVEEGN